MYYNITELGRPTKVIFPDHGFVLTFKNENRIIVTDKELTKSVKRKWKNGVKIRNVGTYGLNGVIVDWD